MAEVLFAKRQASCIMKSGSLLPPGVDSGAHGKGDVPYVSKDVVDPKPSIEPIEEPVPPDLTPMPGELGELVEDAYPKMLVPVPEIDCYVKNQHHSGEEQLTNIWTAEHQWLPEDKLFEYDHEHNDTHCWVNIKGESKWVSDLFNWKVMRRATAVPIEGTPGSRWNRPAVDRWQFKDLFVKRKESNSSTVDGEGVESLMDWLTSHKVSATTLTCGSNVGASFGLVITKFPKGSLQVWWTLKSVYNNLGLKQCDGKHCKFAWIFFPNGSFILSPLLRIWPFVGSCWSQPNAMLPLPQTQNHGW